LEEEPPFLIISPPQRFLWIFARISYEWQEKLI
jgi:hypothetical protein